MENTTIGIYLKDEEDIEKELKIYEYHQLLMVI